MIVSVSPASFELAEQKLLYCVPTGHATKNVDYIAFYRRKPVSAVTHYGKVSRVEDKVYYSKYYDTKPYWLKRNSVRLKCYFLHSMIELPSRIVRTQKRNAVIRPLYSDLEKLLNARTLEDL